MDPEAVGMVILALSTIFGAFAIVAKPMLSLNATITRLESVLTSLQEKMAEASRMMRDQDARLDRAETTLTEHGLRIERLEEECERRHRWT